MSEPATIVLHVIADAAPVATDDAVAATEDQPAAIALRGSDSDDTALDFTVTVMPQHGTLSGTPPNLSYLPALDYNGDDELTFVVSDGFRSSAPATIAIHVAPVDDAPTAAPQTVALDEDGSVTITLAGSDVDGDALSFQIQSGSGPFGGTLSPLVGATMTYTPRRDFNGTDSFRFVASDGRLLSQAATVTIHVAPVPDPPTAFDQSVSLNEDATTTIRLSGTDPDFDTLRFAVASGPQHGTLSGAPPVLTYTPGHDFNGSDSFTFTASDGTLTSAPATVSLQIRAVNDPPVAQNASATTAEDTPVTITLPVTDVDSSSLTYFVQIPPSDGSTTLSGGNLTYTPALNATGTRSLTYFASDGLLSSNVATVTLQITPINDGPITTDDYLATDPGDPVTFTVTGNDVDPEGDPFHLDSVENPAHGTIDMAADGHLTYTPDDGFTGIDVFGYTVVDSHGAATTGQIHIGVGSFPPGAPIETIATVVADPNDRSNAPSMSEDGRYIAFVTASALVPEDTNGSTDVYVYDRGHRSVARVSVASHGDQANGSSVHPQISANGRYIVFDSAASNLVTGDGNAASDVFRHDRVTGETIRISVPFTGPGVGGGTMPTISDDGNLVAFSSTAFDLVPNDANGASDVFVRDVTAGTTTRISGSTTGSDGDLASSDAMISGDGRHVAFSSFATNLITGDTNNLIDVFVRDLAAATTVRASVSSTGGEANAASSSPSLSRDGRFVSFVSPATNLVLPAGSGNRVYVRDTQAPTTIRPTATSAIWGRLSGDGRYLAELLSSSVMLFDRFAATSANLSGNRTWLWPVMSSNGRYVLVVETRAGSVVLTVAANPFGPL
ncbi:MAG: tandem-95 repeat protein [Deltaproteobacteria bacterium]|nr:MAG: tandem-95 repeat protein [Deltaproteobacteria bacterium]